jgi:cytochrome c oxidase subunit 2
VEIRVSTSDVNHGFGLYDAGNRLVAQTQAMPGYTNVIRHRFTGAGTYRVLCLEYCGLGHHTMTAQLVVNASSVTGGNQP